MVTILLTRRCGRGCPGRIFLCLSPLFVSSNLTSWLQRPTKTPMSLLGWEHLFGICAGGFLAVGCQVTQWERRQQSQPSPSCERCADEQVAQLETEENTSLWGTPAYFTDCGFISRLTGAARRSCSAWEDMETEFMFPQEARNHSFSHGCWQVVDLENQKPHSQPVF